MYAKGEGVAADPVESLKWIRLAAEQGHAEAQVSLGFKYEFGNGVPRASVRALMWVSLAAAQGAKNLQVSLQEIEADMTPEQIAKAQALATKCKAANYKGCD